MKLKKAQITIAGTTCESECIFTFDLHPEWAAMLIKKINAPDSQISLTGCLPKDSALLKPDNSSCANHSAINAWEYLGWDQGLPQ